MLHALRFVYPPGLVLSSDMHVPPRAPPLLRQLTICTACMYLQVATCGCQMPQAEASRCVQLPFKRAHVHSAGEDLIQDLAQRIDKYNVLSSFMHQLCTV